MTGVCSILGLLGVDLKVSRRHLKRRHSSLAAERHEL
jgi:hypothetical protein